MNKDLTFSASAWKDYLYWQKKDKKTLKRINLLLRDISRGGYGEIGKPEPLKGDKNGLWSRRIDDEHRLLYKMTNDSIEIVQCRTHYE